MNELRQEVYQNTHIVQDKTFNQLQTNSNQLLRQKADQNFNAEYRQKIQELQKRENQLKINQDKNFQEQADLKFRKQNLKQELLKKGTLEARQKVLSVRERQIEEKSKHQNKELQIIQRLQSLKAQIDRTQTENALNQMKNEHKAEINKLNYQLELTTLQLQNLKEKNQGLQKRNQQIKAQLKAEKDTLLQVRMAHQVALGQWQQSKSSLRKYYDSEVIQLEKVMEKQQITKTRKNQQQLQKTILDQKDKITYLQIKIEEISKQKQMLIQSNRKSDILLKQSKEKWIKSDQENKRLKKQLTKRDSSLIEQIQRQKNELQAHFNKQISDMFDYCNTLSNEGVEAIKEQLKSNVQEIRKQCDILLQKQLEQFNVQRQQFGIKLKKCQEEALKKRQQQKRKFQYQINIKDNRINDIETLLRSIVEIILGHTYRIIDNSKLVEAVQLKMNDLKAQIQKITVEKTSLLQANNTLQLNSKEVRRWFRNITSLLSYEQAAAELVKNKQYGINDQDVIDSIHNFTSKLKATLFKHQTDDQEKDNLINKLKQQLKGLNYAKNDLQKNLGRISEKNTTLEEQLRRLKLQIDGRIQNINGLNMLISRLQRQKKELRQGLALKESEIIISREEINGLQSGKVVFFNRMKEEQNKRQAISAEMTKIKEMVRFLEEQKQNLMQLSQNRKSESDERLKKLQEYKRQMTRRQNEWRNLREVQLNKFRSVINELYDSPAVENTIESMLQFIKNNKGASEGEPLIVSHILQTAAKERSLLKGYICDFLQCRSIKTTLLYKYDEFNKNISNYLPIKSQYNFLILAKSKKCQIFGVVSTGIGAKLKAMAFNLNSGKTFHGESNVSASAYEGGYLIFGQGEIRFKSNLNLQMVVTTRIFNTRYFSFMKQDLVGAQTGDSVLLDALEIHRIDN